MNVDEQQSYFIGPATGSSLVRRFTLGACIGAGVVGREVPTVTVLFWGGSSFNDGTTQTVRDPPLKGGRFNRDCPH
jgi:hypothetical protein